MSTNTKTVEQFTASDPKPGTREAALRHLALLDDAPGTVGLKFITIPWTNAAKA
jgi:hypothetical protein